ncbi:Pycsar system effector family protein [Flavobacterium muglaense]|uniref:HD domain-containing protein n=1 Tax=Flavobacterium muglaense TaxID=2764716 RepID=A0A923SIB3_9FLAO|nr:Pycsar system effector family protein [Flavobacterium muglaense]MBC5836601.1 HD domain-containing protein [Flavobacterium muglaense]MBC5843133.1 HD domain-containing protein [Flavobacterium muglaense]
MDLIKKAENFVCKLLKDKLSISFTYHNVKHTTDVVQAVELLSQQEGLTAADHEKVVIAAWFHDTGYIRGCDSHELSSVVILTDFLLENGLTNAYIDQVAALIKATIFNHVPATILEKIMRDADYSHFASPDYLSVCELLRKEWENMGQKTYNDLDWAKENYRILNDCHSFYTEFAIANWSPLKQKNIALVQNKIIQKEEVVIGNVAKIKDKKKKAKSQKPDRGIDTLFRITLSNHTRLSGIADSKANILLSVNAIIISIALSSIIPKLDSPSNAHLVMPTFIMLMFSVVSIVFAILSTRPKVTSGVFSRQDIEDRKVNLLFFGNFYKMPLEEYEWAVNEMMKDNEYLYNSMIKDLYFLGLVLEKKYRLLRMTYNIFMIGIIVSVIAFVLAFYSVRA